MGFIRLLLAISVIIAHSSSLFGLTLVGGQIAVELFYIISGFYMALILSTKYSSPSLTSLFFRNRFLKIFPVYWLVLVIVLITGIIFKSSVGNSLSFEAFFKYSSVLTPASWVYLIFVNLFLFGTDTTNFLRLNTDTGNFLFTPNFRDFIPETWNFLIIQQSWTIALELTFYLLAPWLNKQTTRRLILIIILAILAKLIAYQFGLNHDPWTYRFFPFEIAFFLIGMLSCRLYHHIQSLSIPSRYLVLLFITTILLIFCYQYLPTNTKKKLVLFIFVPLVLPFIFKGTNQIRFDQLLGELSYPIYLIHFLPINIFAQYFKVPQFLLGIYSTLASLIFSCLLFLIIIQPLNRFRHKPFITAKID